MSLPNLDDVPELELATDGQHELEIVRAKDFTSQKGNACMRLVFRVLDQDTADDVSIVMVLPDEVYDDTKAYRRKASRIRKFMESFNLDSGMEPDEMVGAVGNAITYTKQAYSGEGQENDIRTFV